LAENASFVWFYLPCRTGKSAGNSVNPISNPLGPERLENRPNAKLRLTLEERVTIRSAAISSHQTAQARGRFKGISRKDFKPRTSNYGMAL
jgi:hypothetical protein